MRPRIPFNALVALSAAALLLTAVFAAPACGSNRFRVDPDRSGKIVDSDTGKPLAGVVVMAMWTTDVFRLVIEPRTEYYDYFETVTDETGRFSIPGKGMILFRNLNPPTFKIFKAGYGSMHLNDLGVHFKRDSPFRDQVAWADGKPVIFFRKKTRAEREKSIGTQRGVPFSEMAIPGLPKEKYRLYTAEVTAAYHALGMTPDWEQDHRFIRVRQGGVYPAQDAAVAPGTRP